MADTKPMRDEMRALAEAGYMPLPAYLEAVEKKPKPFRCGTCRKGFGNRGSLHQHRVARRHDMIFECFGCGKKFASASARDMHERSTGHAAVF